MQYTKVEIRSLQRKSQTSLFENVQKCRKIHGLGCVNLACARARVTQPSPHIFLHTCNVHGSRKTNTMATALKGKTLASLDCSMAIDDTSFVRSSHTSGISLAPFYCDVCMYVRAVPPYYYRHHYHQGLGTIKADMCSSASKKEGKRRQCSSFVRCRLMR